MNEYRLLIERAVDSVELKDELDVVAVEHATAELKAAIVNDKDSGQRDVEFALHLYLFDLAQQLPVTVGSDSANLKRLLAAIDIATLFSDNGTTDGSFVFMLLEETMDMVSISVASEIFAHVEQRAHVLRRGMTATGGKGIVMLKMCNGLLRRIPQATMSEFAGRVQVFVGNSFALSERSGVNLRGDFDRTSVAQPANVSDEEDSVYQSFWSMQQFFADPQLLTKGEEGTGVTQFINAATIALEEFRKTNNSRSATLKFDPTGHETLKHLTSPALLRMQFGDAQFKCQILLQMLIFVKYVMAMSGDRIKRLRETATNKFALNELALSTAEQKQLYDVRRRAGNQLVSAANDRGVFSRTAQFVVYHEGCWARWKAESCKPFEQPPLTGLLCEIQSAARMFLQVQGVEFGSELVPMGSEHLAAVWRTKASPTDLHMLGAEVRGLDLLAAMQRLDIYCRDDGDYDMLTASEQARADVLQWRALRSSVFDNMFRKVDPASRSLKMLREEVFPQSDGDAMQVES
ncbi:hypothetical protein IW142_005474 [Coemansia sp. RSA 564]|nr:hypothetical protein IW142_005474 [Coemansia sp. RSA 564]KAJ2403598.1 hypothetical protein J3F80_005416 [Coemansia sp. RSA 2526]